MAFNIIPWDRSNHGVRRERSPFVSLQQEINQVFEDFFGGREPSLQPAEWTAGRNMVPAVDIIETDNGFKVEAELPGMKQEDVEVTINDDFLTIKGEKKASKEDKSENYIRRERFYGNYQRMIALPETAEAGKARATFKKGVLWIEVPKKAGAVKEFHKLEIKEAA